jgi:hypothetical protein
MILGGWFIIDIFKRSAFQLPPAFTGLESLFDSLPGAQAPGFTLSRAAQALLRRSRTLSNSDIWYEVNRVSGNDLVVAGALITVSSLTMLVLAQRWTARNVVITLLSVMIISLVGVAWHGYLTLRRL